MDPNALLTHMLELAVEIDDFTSMDADHPDYYDQDPADLAELAEALAADVMNLHAWMSRGGAGPEAWAK